MTTHLDKQSRERASAYVKALAPTPTVFAAAVRLLVSDSLKNQGELRPVTKLMVSQALRGKKILSMLYYSTLKLNPNHLNGKAHITLGELVNAFAPYDLAVLYAEFLLYRRVRKQLGLDQEGFNLLVPRFRADSIVAGLVGAAIPSIGIGNALLGGTLHHLSLAVIALKELDKVKAYMHHLEACALFSDHSYEAEHFGCLVHQVGTVLMSRFGFSTRIAESYLNSMEPSLSTATPELARGSAISFSRVWIEALHAGLAQPAMRIPGDYYPLARDKEELLEQAKAAREGAISWFERCEQDISPQITPLLFSDEGADKDIPDELQDIFSLKEISEMDEDQFDDLIDEIDRNIEKGTLENVLSTETAVEP